MQPFGVLQTRIGRTKPSRKLLESTPVRFLAYDLLEHDGDDLRAQPLVARRARLERLLADVAPPLMVADVLHATSWDELAQLRAGSRKRRVEGLMLKWRESAYGTGRTRGAWWKWKTEPFTFDAVLVYAQPGGRSSPYRYSSSRSKASTGGHATSPVWPCASRGSRAGPRKNRRRRRTRSRRSRP